MNNKRMYIIYGANKITMAQSFLDAGCDVRRIKSLGNPLNIPIEAYNGETAAQILKDCAKNKVIAAIYFEDINTLRIQ